VVRSTPLINGNGRREGRISEQQGKTASKTIFKPEKKGIIMAGRPVGTKGRG